MAAAARIQDTYDGNPLYGTRPETVEATQQITDELNTLLEQVEATPIENVGTAEAFQARLNIYLGRWNDAKEDGLLDSSPPLLVQAYARVMIALRNRLQEWAAGAPQRAEQRAKDHLAALERERTAPERKKKAEKEHDKMIADYLMGDWSGVGSDLSATKTRKDDKRKDNKGSGKRGRGRGTRKSFTLASLTKQSEAELTKKRVGEGKPRSTSHTGLVRKLLGGAFVPRLKGRPSNPMRDRMIAIGRLGDADQREAAISAEQSRQEAENIQRIGEQQMRNIEAEDPTGIGRFARNVLRPIGDVGIDLISKVPVLGEFIKPLKTIKDIAYGATSGSGGKRPPLSIHAIVIDKSVPLEEARKSAESITKKKLGFMRESGESYRFRVIPKTKFRRFISKQVNDKITIVFGILK